MPRTKINKTGLMKRNRRNSTDEKKEEFLREYEIEVENMLASMKTDYNALIEGIDSHIKKLISKIPENVKMMKWGDLEGLVMDEEYKITNLIAESTMSNLETTIKKTANRVDEGYLTEETSVTSNGSGPRGRTRSRSRSTNKSVVGPLPTARTKPKRSMSAGGRIVANTPGPKAMMSSKKAAPLMRTASNPVNNVPSTHASRSKYRTPMAPRSKAASADRIGVITPKCQPNTPLAILRHARVGETVFSVTGSPVVVNTFAEPTANVNIPMASGVLSIRPAELTSIDPNVVGKIDANTLNHLKQLKANLDLIMMNAEEKFNKKK